MGEFHELEKDPEPGSKKERNEMILKPCGHPKGYKCCCRAETENDTVLKELRFGRLNP